MLIGVHGAGLEWIHFLQKGKALLELAWPDHHWPFFCSSKPHPHREATRDAMQTNGARCHSVACCVMRCFVRAVWTVLLQQWAFYVLRFSYCVWCAWGLSRLTSTDWEIFTCVLCVYYLKQWHEPASQAPYTPDSSPVQVHFCCPLPNVTND